MSKVSPVLMWFRLDLRLDDNPALKAAVETGAPVIPVYIRDDENAGDWKAGGASRWWLHHSLQALDADLQKAGFQPLVYLHGDSLVQLRGLIDQTGADAVFWNRLYEPWAMQRDSIIKASLKKDEINAQSLSGYLMFEPWDVKNKTGGNYKVYTPFSKACFERDVRKPCAKPKVKTPPISPAVQGLSLQDLDFMPDINWYAGLADTWQPGEAGAKKCLKAFAQHADQYKAMRDFPGQEGVSRLSPYLHFGEISPYTVWHHIDVQPYRRQLIWREFSYHLLYHAQDLPDMEWNKKFVDFPWQNNLEHLKAWQKGRTGIPIVDAGMRQLWQTGWMHNRVRMITGSFLVKNLLLDWREGEKWFWDTLVDADLGNNAAGWQWIAGCGADAAPYFRVFNPVLQSKKFDLEGAYIRRFVPELKDVESKYIHEPWDMPPLLRQQIDYPEPLVDIYETRDRALAAYQEMKDAAA